MFFYNKANFVKKHIMKTLSILVLFFLVSQFCFSQKKLKYETIFFNDNSVETAQAKITTESAICEKEFIKTKLVVTNYTNKPLVIKPKECSFSSPKGDLFSKDKWLIVAPHDKESKVIDAKGEDIKTDESVLNLNGLYICNNSEKFSSPDMKLPPEKKIKIGNFELELDTWDRDGKEIMIKYNVKYIGDKVGLFSPSKVLLKSAEGTEYKNQKEKDKIYAFAKNEDRLIGFLYVSDSKKENILLWKDAFEEFDLEKLENIAIKLEMDLAKTKDKN